MCKRQTFRHFLATDINALSLMTVPALALFVIFVLFPLISGLQISFTNWNGYSQHYTYVGLQNYKDMLHSSNVWIALRNTVIYGFGSTALQILLGLALACLLVDRFALRSATRTIVYLPAMVAQLVIGYIWYFLFTYERGALNDVMKLLGKEPVDWLATGARSVLIITLINAIEYSGNTMVIFLAGLESIPDMYKEAASIDGASGWQVFRHITIPLLMPAFTTSLVLNIIYGLKLFGLVVSLTDGGPGFASHSLSSLINTMYFSYQRAGMASAIGVMCFMFIMTVSILLRKWLAKKEAQLNG